MKYFLLLLLILSAATYISAQNDTTITYLDNDEKPCPEAKAKKYALQNKENDHWKKVVFDITDDKAAYAAYYSDSACTQFDGPYNAFNKKTKIIMAGRYANNKKVGVWKGFSDDNKIIDSAFYKDGYISGTALKWYTDGTIMDSLLFEKDGKGSSKGFGPMANRKTMVPI
jgi:antitoxin component YwqK of YwqJK toxin-antitoxin module